MLAHGHESAGPAGCAGARSAGPGGRGTDTDARLGAGGHGQATGPASSAGGGAAPPTSCAETSTGLAAMLRTTWVFSWPSGEEVRGRLAPAPRQTLALMAVVREEQAQVAAAGQELLCRSCRNTRWASPVWPSKMLVFTKFLQCLESIFRLEQLYFNFSKLSGYIALLLLRLPEKHS
ncbi:UNVERIFIED_CONTAM: hypothetical protein K2H54_055140 [Gekko kuhli]